jgi:hypothetical protein
MRLQTFSGGVPLATTGSTSQVFCASFARASTEQSVSGPMDEEFGRFSAWSLENGLIDL